MQPSPIDLPQRFDRAKSWRSDAYMAWVRSRPCAVSGFEGEEVVAHHVRCLGGGGVGLKPPDWLCVPLRSDLHARLHQIGEETFWREHGLAPLDVICMTLLVHQAQRPSVELAFALAELVQK